jgi:hypothetical protein
MKAARVSKVIAEKKERPNKQTTRKTAKGANEVLTAAKRSDRKMLPKS